MIKDKYKNKQIENRQQKKVTNTKPDSLKRLTKLRNSYTGKKKKENTYPRFQE